MIFIKAFLAALVSFLVIDAIWIALVVRPFYEEQVGALLRDTPNLVGAVAFYLIYIGGVVVLAVRPALATGRIRDALLYGAVLGGVAYSTFTLTNFAVIDGWTTGLVVSDIAWGIFLTAVVAACGFVVARR